jgi:hypothetical protein
MLLRAVPLVSCLALALTGLAAAAEDTDQKPWRVTANVYGYVVPDAPNFVMVTAPVEIGRWHVEGRYNYEALHSGSGFAGVKLGWGQTVRLSVTPMLGIVFGELDGLVPALRLTLNWWRLDLYSELETVIDLHDTGDSFFYAWSELGFTPIHWTRFGAALQRSLVFKTSLDIQRGLFASVTIRFLTLSLYEFNAPWTTPTWVLAASVTF